MLQGKVKVIRREKGFGFITGENGIDYFFHASHVEEPDSIDTLQPGDDVSFFGEMGDKGPFAEEVRGL